MISLKTADEIYSYPPVWWPETFQFGNYVVLFKDGDATTVWNSLVVASASTVLAMFLGTICAYSIARFRTGGEHLRQLDHLPAHGAADRGRVSHLPAVRVASDSWTPTSG